MVRKVRDKYQDLLEYLYSSTDKFKADSTYEILLALLTTQVNADCCLLINAQQQVLYRSPTLKNADFSHTILTKALERNESILIENAMQDEDLKTTGSISGHIFLSVICVVLYGLNNEALGAIYLDRHELDKRTFCIYDLRKVEIFVHKFSHVLIAEGLAKIEMNRMRKDHGFEGMMGESKVMLNIFDQIRKVAPTESNVFLQGKTGTGKELLARAIHNRSRRVGNPFIAINCSAIPRDLLESELFGHEKGAFTGAVNARKGKFHLAHGGTLFLDEICELDPMLQTKILRALQEREIQPLGSEKVIKVDLRLITASSKEIVEEIREGNFRRELFYRINSYQIILPDLKDRGNDILLLAHYFLKQYCIKNTKYIPEPFFTEQAKKKLFSYGWEGNVRELQNVMENLSINHNEGSLIKDTEIKFYPIDIHKKPLTIGNKTLRAAVDELERDIIRNCLIKHNWHKNKVIKELKTTFPTLNKKIEKYGLAKQH